MFVRELRKHGVKKLIIKIAFRQILKYTCECLTSTHKQKRKEIGSQIKLLVQKPKQNMPFGYKPD